MTPFRDVPGLTGGMHTNSVEKEDVMEHSGKRKWITGRALAAGAAALVLAGLVALSAQARGTEWGRHKPSPDSLAARMAERLGLSADQKAQVQEILTQNLAKRAEIREEGRKKMESLRDDTQKRFASVLTPEQMTKLRALREERRDRRRDCSPGRRDGDRGHHGGPPPQTE